MAKNLKVLSVTIPNAGTTSVTTAVDTPRIPLALEMPAVFTGTTLTFKACSSASGTAIPLYLEGSAYSVTVANSRYIALDRRAFEGVKFLQIVSGSTEGADRVINVMQGE